MGSESSTATWIVKSASDPSREYIVMDVGGGEMTCTCKGYAIHRKACRHIRQVVSTGMAPTFGAAPSESVAPGPAADEAPASVPGDTGADFLATIKKTATWRF